MTERQENDSYIDLPPWAVHYPRCGAVHGRHHIPTIGTLFHRKRWWPAKVRVRFQATGQSASRTFTTDSQTMREIIAARTLAEARTLISLCLTDGHP